MPTDSGFISTGSKNHVSITQDVPASSDTLIHRHNTARRIFIGPTPTNWSYRRGRRFFFKNNPSKKRSKSFNAEATGPANVESLDFNANSDIPSVESQSEPYLAISSSSNEDLFSTRAKEIHTDSITQPDPISPSNVIDDGSREPGEQNKLDKSSSLTNSESSGSSSFRSSNENAQDEIDNETGFVEQTSSEPASANRMQPKNPDAIIKKDRMLVRIEYTYHRFETPVFYDDHTARHSLAHSAGWREYVGVLRSSRIDFYKSRKTRDEYLVFSSSVKLTLLSALDYTIVLSEPFEEGMKMVILRPPTKSLSIEWYSELYNLLNTKPMPTSLEIVVPILNDVRINIPLPAQEGKRVVTVENLMGAIRFELSGVNEWEEVLDKLSRGNQLGLCWKRYDRIEWITQNANIEGSKYPNIISSPQFIEGSHQLQLRETKHYPTEVTLPNGTKLQEPPPVEGYLIRLPNGKRKKKSSKRLYFSSHNQYLFYIPPISASPPPPPIDTATTTQPLIYSVAPFHSGHDSMARGDLKRRVKQICNSKGFLDLTKVEEVRTTNPENNTVEPPDVATNEVTKEEGLHSSFELVFENGIITTLQAYSEETMTEWVNRLNALVAYWRARSAADVQIRVQVLRENKSNDTENDDARRSTFWLDNYFDNFQAATDPTIWNMCVSEGCRAITKSGPLYVKRRQHGTFTHFYYILAREHLICYKIYSRSATGGSIVRTYHKRKGTIPLRDCYVYSGSITESDLRNDSSSQFNASANKLPRLYSDGMYSFDQGNECTFVVWCSTKRRYFSKDGGAVAVKKAAKLGVRGRTWVFRARSRMEREEWVCALNTEIDKVREEEQENLAFYGNS